jgi:CoA:oxalate CoA-transferase
MSMPLEGLLVIDWSVWVAGPGAAMILGDLGANVIKIEDRTTGDPTRGVEFGVGLDDNKPPQAIFESCNRNKRGITLNLRNRRAKDIVYGMVEKADAFITNFRESVTARYGMDYDTLTQYNPQLVYGMVTGYGSKGPEADDRSYDGVGQARSGIMIHGEPGHPCYISQTIGDTGAGINCALGVVTALLARERKGIGQKVETSLLSSLLFQQWANLGMKFIGGIEAPPKPRTRPLNPLVNTYKCSDDKWVFLFHLEADRFWPNVCKALSIEHLQNDPRFNNIAKRRENADLVTMLDRIFATKKREEWISIFKENDGVCGAVNTYDDLLTDPQIIANNYLPEFDHPNYGKIREAPIPFDFSKTPGELRLPAPEFGQHTEEVLMELLGYDWDMIAQLKEEDVI